MNKLTIIGNLTRDPELRTTTSGVNVCSFTVAVNKPKKNGEDQGADFFNVTAWRERGELCAKYLAKGRKVCVIGPVSIRMFTRNDGATSGNLEVTADEIEFLSPRNDSPVQEAKPQKPEVPKGFTQVEMNTDELPF